MGFPCSKVKRGRLKPPTTGVHARNLGGARLLADRDMLAGAVNFLLANEGKRHEMIAAALATVNEMRGALPATLKALEPYINPLIVKARLDDGTRR